MADRLEKLQNIIDVGLEVAQVKDLDILLEKVLSAARSIANADAGSVYVRENDSLIFSHTQNETLQGRLAPGKKLIYAAFTVPVDNLSIAGYVAATGEVVNLADVYRLPPGVTFTFNRSYDELSGYRTRSCLTLPLRTPRGEVVGVLQLINARDTYGAVTPFPTEDEPFLMHFANHAATAVERAQLTRAMILRMIKMAELRDPKETGAHVNRVGSYSVALYDNWAAARGIPAAEIERTRDVLRMAAMLHDVGKVAISDTVLKKPSRFTPEEFEVMKQHTVLGARLFGDLLSEFDEAAAVVALNHHERWDGAGYPGHVDPRDGAPLPGHARADGSAAPKRAEEIPLFGRLVAVADVYDALCSRRCYKPAWDECEVVRTVRGEAGGQFDPELVEVFCATLEELHHISARYPDEE